MHPVLNKNLFLVKEHVGMFKAANNYDIYNPETGEIIFECREDRLGIFSKKILTRADTLRYCRRDFEVQKKTFPLHGFSTSAGLSTEKEVFHTVCRE